jgi:hypothetical protein
MQYRSLQDIFRENKKWTIYFFRLLNPLIHLN